MTSRSNTVLVVQFAGAVTASVGAIVTSGDGVNVFGTNPGFVGGKVAVTKFGRTGVDVSEATETEMQDVSRMVMRKMGIFLYIICSVRRTRGARYSN